MMLEHADMLLPSLVVYLPINLGFWLSNWDVLRKLPFWQMLGWSVILILVALPLNVLGMLWQIAHEEN